MILLCERPGNRIAILTLNRPEARNALSAELRKDLRIGFEELAADESVHAIVLLGAGGNFCAGGDIRTMGETDIQAIESRMAEVAQTVEAVAGFPKPIVAAVAGHAAGGGVGLACLADVIVAEESAQFTFSFLRIGLGPDWGLSYTLPRRIGTAAARRLILARESVPAREAYRMGFADVLTGTGEAREVAISLAREFAEGPSRGAAGVKALFADPEGLRAALKAETALQHERFQSWEHHEGIAAFREKRRPDFGKNTG